MGTALVVLAFVATTCLAAPLAVFIAAARLMRPARGDSLPLFLFMAPAAPFAIALVMMVLYSLPWQTPIWLHLAFVIALIAAAIAMGRDQLAALRADLSDARARLRGSFSITGFILGLVVLGLSATTLLQVLSLPVIENDSLEYLAVAREVFRAGSLSVYPLTQSAPSGMFAPSAHPPAIHLFLVWGSSWVGIENFAPSRVLAAFCLFGMMSLLAAGLSREGLRSVAVAIIVMLCTPIYVLLLVGYHVDGLRIMAVAGAIVAMARVIENPDKRTAVLAGVWLGCAAFSHSIGVLCWVLAAFAWLVLGPSDRFRRFGVPLVIGIVAVAIGGAQYVKNIIILGVPLHDHVAVAGLPELRFYEDLIDIRKLASFSERLTAGPLFGFASPDLFGITYWVGLAAFAFLLRNWTAIGVTCRVSILWFLFISILGFIGAAFNITLLIKNARYLPLTAVPALAIIAGSAVAQLERRRASRHPIYVVFPIERVLAIPRQLAFGALLAGFAFVAARWTIDQSINRLSLHGARLDFLSAGERAFPRRGSNYNAARIYSYLETNADPRERTLTFFQPGTAIYGTGSWIDQHDDQMIPFYMLAQPDAAYAWLRDRNVRYVFVPGYYLSTFSRSVAEQLVADERYSELLINDKDGWRLYRLRDEPLAARYACAQLDDRAVFEEISYRLGLISRLAHVSARPELITYSDEQIRKFRPFGQDGGGVSPKLTSPFARTHRVYTGEGPVWVEPKEEWLSTSGDSLMRVEIETGDSQGYFIIYVGEYGDSATGPFQRYARVWDGILERGTRKISFQIRPDAQSRKFRVLIDKLNHAPATLTLSAMKVCRN
ncbi:glycosyltransferase family 39 protein [Boseaceae bacterium BT-24-1]|nr:glycosyltransferase family 39 protein [Boseaceae bacterium BT-24-1]